MRYLIALLLNESLKINRYPATRCCKQLATIWFNRFASEGLSDRQTTLSNISRADTVLYLLRLIMRSQACVNAYTKSHCQTNLGLTEHALEIITGKGYLTIATFSPGMMRYGNHTDLCKTPGIRHTQFG